MIYNTQTKHRNYSYRWPPITDRLMQRIGPRQCLFDVERSREHLQDIDFYHGIRSAREHVLNLHMFSNNRSNMPPYDPRHPFHVDGWNITYGFQILPMREIRNIFLS